MTSVKFNAYKIISRAVEEGAKYGLSRAYKHQENPDNDSIIENVEREVMSELCEVIDFCDES